MSRGIQSRNSPSFRTQQQQRFQVTGSILVLCVFHPWCTSPSNWNPSWEIWEQTLLFWIGLEHYVFFIRLMTRHILAACLSILFQTIHACQKTSVRLPADPWRPTHWSWLWLTANMPPTRQSNMAKAGKSQWTYEWTKEALYKLAIMGVVTIAILPEGTVVRIVVSRSALSCAKVRCHGNISDNKISTNVILQR